MVGRTSRDLCHLEAAAPDDFEVVHRVMRKPRRSTSGHSYNSGGQLTGDRPLRAVLSRAPAERGWGWRERGQERGAAVLRSVLTLQVGAK